MYPRQAKFRVDITGVWQDNNMQEKRGVVVFLPRETPAAGIRARAKAVASDCNEPKAGRIVLLKDRSDEIDSLAPKFGKEYEAAAKRKTLEYLLADRLSNYGYEWKDWCQLRSQRQAAKRAVEKVVCHKGIDALDWGTWNQDRLTLDDRRPDYTTGQSNNEEITGVLRVLAGLTFYPKSRE